jgi:hypothetical protein
MRKHLMLLAACALTSAACTENGTGPGSELQILAPEQELVEGTQMTLSVTAGGQPLGSREVSWSSSDSTTVKVTNGVIRGVAPGVAYVRARSGMSRDSVEISVRFAQSAIAGMAIRIAGETSEIVRLKGVGMITQPIGIERRHLQIRAGSESEGEAIPGLGMGDSLLFINFPGPIAVGTAILNPTNVDWPSWGFAGDSGAFFEIRDSGSRLRFYFPVTSPRLEIREIQLPAEPGNVAGLITGSIWFEAAGIVSDFNETTRQSFIEPLSDTTIAIYAEFVTPIYHVLTPRMAASVEGGPDAGTFAAGGAAVVNEGGLSLRLHGISPTSQTSENGVTMLQGSVWVPSPAVGTTSIGVADASVLTDSIGAPNAWARLSSVRNEFGTLLPALHSFSESGTIAISSYQAPTQTAFGQVEGEVTTVLRYPPGASAQGTTTLKWRFLMPVNPLGGHPLDRPEFR